jgi:hypothetical protein
MCRIGPIFSQDRFENYTQIFVHTLRYCDKVVIR